MAGGTLDERRKRADETDLQWKLRVMQLDTELRDKSGPLVTKEAETHAEYRDEFVLHIETLTLARTKRNVTITPIMDLYNRGAIDKDQFSAAVEIQMAAEVVQSAVALRGASLEARVDNSGSARDALVEHIAGVRVARTYTLWRQRLPTPKRLVLDMLLERGSLASTARKHGASWPKARKILIRSLDRWIELREKVGQLVDDRDVEAIHLRIGEGLLANSGLRGE